MHLVDTHCHIHSSDYPITASEVFIKANIVGVDKIICVGTDLSDSQKAIEFANKYDNTWASIGIHPHEADKYVGSKDLLNKFSNLVNSSKVIAIGECGLDYFYNHSSKTAQTELLKFQIELAIEHSLPLIFHVRDAFDDFWSILDKYPTLTGVVHSFTDSITNLNIAINRGYMIGVNGISTFTKNPDQIEMYKQIPISSLVLETDSPYLTPAPFRGIICEPKHIKVVADFLVKLRGETLENLANQTTKNAKILFRI
ncbi:MAG TPA: TatD family hydrolase [Candidatus Saccharimonadales bacterium]|jgi:TatD DNase family protein|nr:TatD family hydrolase [Candidatus Saccharimonadales bacterium]